MSDGQSQEGSNLQTDQPVPTKVGEPSLIITTAVTSATDVPSACSDSSKPAPHIDTPCTLQIQDIGIIDTLNHTPLESDVALGENDIDARIQALNEVNSPSQPAEPATNTPTTTPTSVTSHEMELTELRVKVICLEKNVLALKMDVKSANLTVAAKEKVDVKKTRLIELLDAKMSAVEKRNVKLLEMLEQMLKEKEGSSTRLKAATKNMEDLSQRLIDSERMKTELLRMNAELKGMLDNIEVKGTQIAKLAKEKVLKYKDENNLMQQELTDLKDGAAAASAAAQVFRTETAVSNSPARTLEGEACWNKINELQKLIANRLQDSTTGVDTQTVEAQLRETISYVVGINEELKQSIDKMKETTTGHITQLNVENEQLRSIIEEAEVEQRRNDKKDLKARAENLEAQSTTAEKDKEIAELKEELQRLKGAIGQLIGAK